MRLSLCGFVLRRVRDHLRQLAWAHTLTAGIMALALFVLGAFMLIEINLERLLRGGRHPGKRRGFAPASANAA